MISKSPTQNRSRSDTCLTTRCSGPVHRVLWFARRCANSGAVARLAEREALGTGKKERLPTRLGHLLWVFLLPCTFYTAASCLPYEPEEVTLCGQVHKIAYPGPPNFESIKDGDRPLTYWYLFLATPVCVKGKPNDDLDVDEKNVEEIQLILDATQYKKYEQLVAKNACVSGILTHGITGYHFRALLLEVKSMKPSA